MDPITILAAASTAFNGIKKAVELGRETQDIFDQLKTWSGHVSDFHNAVSARKNKKPGIFSAIRFDKSETEEAFDEYSAKQRIIEMEKEIHTMFLYGSLSHLGADGYRDFRKMREQIREKRTKLIQNQLRARMNFIENIQLGIVIFTIVALLATFVVFGINIYFK